MSWYLKYNVLHGSPLLYIFQGRRSIKHEKIIINELWYWVSKFMGLIYPWHRSGLCSHYLYPTNIGATQLQAPGFNRLPCLLGRGHPRPSWTLPSCGILFRNIIQDRRGEKLLGAEGRIMLYLWVWCWPGPNTRHMSGKVIIICRSCCSF